MSIESGLTTIVIPTYQHAAVVCEAIRSALAQNSAVEVIVIDDGSTDNTAAAIADIRDERLTYVYQKQAGPSAARNFGIEAARGEFVMFLDADDLIAPNKVETQLAEMVDGVGWVLCDVRIEDEARNEVVNASARYRYDYQELDGWIRPKLEPANLIPIMSPLIRRSVLGDSIRFDDSKVPEDWHFWLTVASSARVRYVPKVLATYRKKRTGRSRLPKASRMVSRNIVQPLRLNLGCGTPNTRSWHPIAGMVNLDKSMGWAFEDGLGEFVDHSVHGISVSHALMYSPESAWPYVFSEFSRVLADGGVIRITEDDTEHPDSSRRGGWKGSQPAVTNASPALVRAYLERAGLMVYDVDEKTTKYKDRSLCQAQHGAPPDVFFVEGVKLPGTVFVPHSDDEALFCSFTLLRYRPRLIVCFPSSGDYGETSVREAETREAASILGAQAVEQWQGGDLRDLVRQMQAFDRERHPVRVWAPDQKTSHPDHLAVARAAAQVFGDRLTTFHTYDRNGKVRDGTCVPFEPQWLQHKLRALARYKTQIEHPRAHVFFTADMLEYYGSGPA